MTTLSAADVPLAAGERGPGGAKRREEDCARLDRCRIAGGSPARRRSRWTASRWNSVTAMAPTWAASRSSGTGKSRWLQSQGLAPRRLLGSRASATGSATTSVPARTTSITEIGLTPVFRLQQNDLRGPVRRDRRSGLICCRRPRSATSASAPASSSATTWASGYRFGAKGAFDLAYRYQHLSNASIKKPNDGINFHQVRLQYHF